jgi:hypothetical protein
MKKKKDKRKRQEEQYKDKMENPDDKKRDNGKRYKRSPHKKELDKLDRKKERS